jgi:ABC-2 type transport system permease protein
MICWFFAGIFPLIMNNYRRDYFLDSVAQMENPFFAIFIVAFPLIASVATLRYLFSPGSVSAMHTLPLTRGRLYCTNYVSCAVMTLAPVAVTFAVLAVAGGFNGRIFAAFALLALLALLHTAIFHAAAMLTGNVVAHIGISGFLAAVIPGVLLLVFVYFQSMLFGFMLSGDLDALCIRLLPVIYIFAENLYSPAWMIVYVLAIPALYVAGAALYSRRSLERAGDSVVFSAFEAVLTFVVTFAGMTLMSMIFDGAGWGDFPYNLGSVIGAALMLIAVRMLMKKSVRVFNKRTLLQGAVFAGAAAMFLGGISLDVTGFEKRVPAPERVKYAELYRQFTPALGGRNIYMYNGSSGNLVFTEPENIRSITEMHKSITSLRGKYVNGRRMHYTSIAYQLDGGRLSRQWHIPYEHLRDDPNVRALFESEEFKLQNDIRNAALGQPSRIYIFSNPYYPEQNGITLSSDEYAGLLNALAEDMRRETWDELISNRTADLTVSIDYYVAHGASYTADTASAEIASPNPAPYSPENTSYISSAGAHIEVPPHYARTIEWLTERGYYDRLTQWKQHIIRADLAHFIGGDGWIEPTDNAVTINDPELIRQALDSSQRTLWNWDDYWEMTVYIETNYIDGAVEACRVYFPAGSEIVNGAR